MYSLKLKYLSSYYEPLLNNVKLICENLNENYYFAINELNQIVEIKNRQVNVVYDLNKNLNDSIDNVNETLNQSDHKLDLKNDLNNSNNDLLKDNLIVFGHLPDLNLICLIYSNGLICTLNLDDKQFDKNDLGVQLVIAGFSPECDKIVLTTESNKLILLNSFLEEINQSELDDKRQGAVDHLNVGWGKKETQFHGSEGKQARIIKKELLTCGKFDDLKPRLTWRDDGVYFAVSVVDKVKNTRKIRIYDSEGIFQQASDEHSGLEYTLNWKPNGNLITSSVCIATGHSIVFFEKNGQRFDEFRLPYKKDDFEIQQILWSNVADCIVILGLEHCSIENQNNNVDHSKKPTQIILIYSMRNFHWYCQQKLIFNDPQNQIKKLINQNQLTNEFEPLNLLILFQNGKVNEYVYSNQIYECSNGNCAVIDGKKLLITPFNFASIPPPMYGYALLFDSEINEICFSKPSGEYLLIQLSNSKLHLIQLSNRNEFATNDLIKSKIDLEFQSISFKQPNLPLIYSKHIAQFELDEDIRSFQSNLTDQKIAFALLSSSKTLSSISTSESVNFENELIKIDFNKKQMTQLNQMKRSIKLILLNQVRSMVSQLLILVEDNGLVWKLKSLNDELNDSKIEPFEAVSGCGKSTNQIKLRALTNSIVKLAVLNDKCIISLYSNYFLYINHLPIQGNDCNSFLIHDENLLMYTTNDHKLRSIWVEDILYALKTFELPNYENENEFRFVKEELQSNESKEADSNANKTSLELSDFIKFDRKQSIANNLKPIDRSIERGSRLVSSCSLNCKLILQMPRGNLEIITPRILVLKTIQYLVGLLQYREAFDLMKKHRIDLNLIIDYDPNCFILNVKQFIQQIGEQNTTDLCLFISELSMDNMLKKMYSTYNQTLENLAKANSKNKSLFDWKFPELRRKKCAANLGDQDCVDGKSIHLESLLNKQKTSNHPKHLVASSLREAMIELGEKKYFIPILLTYLKPPNQSIGTALIKIYEQSDKEMRLNALNYLKYIIDMHHLVKEALATYDLNVAKMVYAISNLDPKEYLPLIARFESHTVINYRNYQIDLHLKQYDKAIENLTNCEPFTDYVKETIELIVQKHLYQTAIDQFKKKSLCTEHLNQIYSLYGDYLLIKKYFNEALLIFKKGSNYQNAIKAAQLANNWNQTIECASLANRQTMKNISILNSKSVSMNGDKISDVQKNNDKLKEDKNVDSLRSNNNSNKENSVDIRMNLVKLYQSTAEQLDNSTSFEDASFVYGFYLNDWYQAVSILIKNHSWAHVFRLLNDSTDDLNEENFKLNENQRNELISLADQTLNKHYEEIVDLLNENLHELRTRTERLQKVRMNKIATAQTISLADNLNDRENEFLNDDQSSVSTVNSVQSGKRRMKRSNSKQSETNSLITNKTSSKKKKERHQYKLKEGSRDEDLALIHHIRLRIKKIENLKSTIKLLLFTLVDREFKELACSLQLMFSKLLDVVSFVKSVIWQDELLLDYQMQNFNKFFSNRTENVNVIQDIKLQKPPKSIDIDWQLIILNN